MFPLDVIRKLLLVLMGLFQDKIVAISLSIFAFLLLIIFISFTPVSNTATDNLCPEIPFRLTLTLNRESDYNELSGIYETFCPIPYLVPEFSSRCNSETFDNSNGIVSRQNYSRCTHLLFYCSLFLLMNWLYRLHLHLVPVVQRLFTSYSSG